jgi:crotonobetainyl-CoA:carnitine CoA-transferase CaiB-like acyl-CoA transferase
MTALDGMRVLDMTQYEAGTSCTQLLAWLGADVVKVEGPEGDPGRQVYGRMVRDSQYFLNYNSNKRSVVLDLRTEAGRRVLMDLVPRFDVFVENYGPGVVERLGLGYEALSAVNPRLVYARIKGFGLSGPYRDYKSFDSLAQAAGGTFSITGFPDGPPVRPGPTFADTGTGAQTALAIVAAYVQQQRTGSGQLIEISMQEVVTTFMRTTPLTQQATAPWGSDRAVRRRGNEAGFPSGMYPSAGGGPNDYVYIMVATSRMWDSLCAAIGRDDLLTDPRFATGRARREHQGPLYEAISAWTLARSKFEAMHTLAGAGVACSAVYDTADLFRDPHLNARGFIQRVEHPVEGEVTLLGQPFRLSGSHVPVRPAPRLGEHTHEVLAAELGLDGDALAALEAAGAIRGPEA